MATLTVEAPTTPVVQSSKGQIIVSTSSKNNPFDLLYGVQAEIRDFTDNLIWRASGAFKEGSVSFNIEWPAVGKYKINVKTVSAWGTVGDVVVKDLDVVDEKPKTEIK